MLLEYDWTVSVGPAPEVNAEVEVSGSPDRPVLRGTVFKAVPIDEEVVILSLLMADGQEGAQDLQEWVASGRPVGIMAVPATIGHPGLFSR